MNLKEKNNEILHPKIQPYLYGYDSYFQFFTSLYNKKKLPNVMLLTGIKGLGKSTFVYHFINYLLSHGEANPYSLPKFKINQNNFSFKLIQNGTHPNFFLLENTFSNEYIKIEQVRNLLGFLNKSILSKNLRIVLIDNAEFLNINSSNALLKSLEEPSSNTFFFIIHNSSSKILDTIKSRCVEYKFHFNNLQKKNIFNKISQNYQINIHNDILDQFLYFDSPGNILRYLLVFNDTNFTISRDILSCILYLMEKYKNKKDPELLNFITLFIENYYNELSLNNNSNLINYFNNKYKILNMIQNMKIFNLNEKNSLTSIDRIIRNETK